MKIYANNKNVTVNLSDYASKEELENYQSKTDETLPTEDKTISGAIKELFQNANNGKQLIANAIGEPVSANDTFSAMSNDINSLLNTFKANMMNNGIAVASGDKFKALIDKIADMAESSQNKGIQFAEGTVPDFRLKFGNGIHNETVVTNLDFEPTVIFVIFDKYAINGSISTNLGMSNFNESVNHEDEMVYIDNISSSSFDLVSDYKYYSTTFIEGIKWYAVGVGEEDTTFRDSLASILQDEGVDVTEEDDMASLIVKIKGLIEGKGNKGIQFASGSIVFPFANGASGTHTCNINCNFTPTHIFLKIPIIQDYDEDEPVTVCNNAIISNLYTFKIIVDWRLSSKPSWEADITNISSTSFDIVGKGTSDVRFNGTNAEWYAIGIGEENTILKDALADILENKGVDVTEEDDMATLITKVNDINGGLDIISATNLPATGKENQICVVTDNPVDNYIVTTNLNDVSTDSNIINLCQLNSEFDYVNFGSPLVIPGGNVSTYHYFYKACQGNNRLPSYVYKNGTWNELTKAGTHIYEQGQVCPGFEAGYNLGGMWTLTQFDMDDYTYQGIGFLCSDSFIYYYFTSKFNVDFSLYDTLYLGIWCNTSPCTFGFYAGTPYNSSATYGQHDDYIDKLLGPNMGFTHATLGGSVKTVAIDISKIKSLSRLMIVADPPAGQKDTYTIITNMWLE